MKTTLLISPIVLLIFLLVIGAIAGMAVRRARVVRSDHFHWIVRVLCAVLALASLVAVGVGTWRATSAEIISPPVMVSLPTQAPPPLPEAKQPNGQVDLGPGKLVGTVLLARKAQDRFLPIGGESRVLDWPPEGNPEMVFRGESGDSSYELRMNLGEFIRWNADGATQVMSGVSVRKRGATWSSSGGMELKLDTLEVEEFGGYGDQLKRAPLSVIPVANCGDLRLLVHLTRAGRDDPLRQASADEWLNGEGGNLRRDERRTDSYQRLRFDSTIPPGIRMLAFLGASAFLLLLAAVVGSALFPRGRRAVAFTGLLTSMVLYAGTLDALILERRASVATDASQPEIVRALAVDNMRRCTFFHAEKATERLRDIAKDPATPAFIRAGAAIAEAE